MSDALDDSVLTDIESGADLLLSTAVPDGLPDPYSPAQDGWTTGAQDIDPSTSAPAASGSPNPFTGQDVDSYTNTAAGGANPNAYAGGQDINPYTAVQDTGPYVLISFGVNSSVFADVTWTGFFTDNNGVTWNQFTDSDGNVSYAPAGNDSNHVFAPLDLTEPSLPPPGTPLPADFVPEPAQTPPAPAATAPSATQPPAPDSSLPPLPPVQANPAPPLIQDQGGTVPGPAPDQSQQQPPPTTAPPPATSAPPPATSAAPPATSAAPPATSPGEGDNWSGLERFVTGFGAGLSEGLLVGAGAALAVAFLPEIAVGLVLFGALSTGVGVGELITGEDLSGHQIDRASFAGHLAGGLVGAAAGGGLVQGAMSPVDVPVGPPDFDSVTIPEGRPAPASGTGQSTIAPRAPGERSLDFGTRTHQELPRIVTETNPQATGQFNVAPGQTGPDFVPNNGLNANYGEMKSLWDSQSRILSQARRWGFDPQTGRYWLYDEHTNTVFEGIFQTEKFPSGRFR
jgi:hypothetical protein